jgi:hypothetical protein
MQLSCALLVAGRATQAGLDFDVVVRLDLKDLWSSDETIGPKLIAQKVLERWGGGKSVEEELTQFATFALKHPASVLWIFDSLDEASLIKEEKPHLCEFLNRLTENPPPWLHNCIVTSRPGVWRKEWKHWRRLELLPFDETRQMEYVRMYFERDQKSAELVQKLVLGDVGLTWVHQNPLTLQLMCFALEDNKLEGRITTTKLYKMALMECAPRRVLRGAKDILAEHREKLTITWNAVLTRLAIVSQIKTNDVERIWA